MTPAPLPPPPQANPASARIQGHGIAASCCAQLLRVPIQPGPRRSVPVLLIVPPTEALLNSLFGGSVLDGCARIQRRIVRWAGRDTVTISHQAALISEDALLERLTPSGAPAAPGAEWTILTAPAESPRAFGTRTARAAQVELSPEADPAACYIESLDDGWLFLAGGWLLSVGGASLHRSELVRRQIASAPEPSLEFPAYPRIAESLCAAGRLSCGPAAMGIDPLCGNGVGNAARQAILASAVVRAAARGADVDALLRHYRGRLSAGFGRHLINCVPFYQNGGQGAWWTSELKQLREGLQWVGQPSAPQFRLNDWDLEPLAASPGPAAP